MHDMESGENNNFEQAKRPVDELAEDTYSWWGKNMVLMLKRNVKSWKFIFFLAFLAGIIIAVIWMVSV